MTPATESQFQTHRPDNFHRDKISAIQLSSVQLCGRLIILIIMSIKIIYFDFFSGLQENAAFHFRSHIKVIINQSALGSERW